MRARKGLRAFKHAALAGLWLAGIAAPARAEVVVVTTTPSLADIASRVGGEQVRATSLMSGSANVHNVIPKPSFVMKLRKADLFVHAGLDAEPWVPNLLRSARRPALLPGGSANVDASAGVELLEVPASNELTRAMGDIHVFGNPHYLLDPLNGASVGYTIASHLSRLDPAHSQLFESRARELDVELNVLSKQLNDRVKSTGLCSVVTYHRTWSYFLERFGIKKLADIEPKPGIASGPRHIANVSEKMKRTNVRLVVSATYEDERTAKRLAESASGRHVVLAQEVGAVPEVDSYTALFEYNVNALTVAAKAFPHAEGECP